MRRTITSQIIRVEIVVALAAMAMFAGCGPESHAPRIGCINIGVENVRRNLRIRVSVGVDRMPLQGVSSETIQLLKLPEATPIAGEVYYSGERIYFTPTEPLQDATEYRFDVKEGISDASGEALPTMSQDFYTGSLLQVYRVDLLRSYDSSADEVYSIAIYFSEGVNSNDLSWGTGNITVYEEDWLDQPFDVTYYEETALAVLLFTSALEISKNYTLTLSADIISDTDVGWLDGDRDGADVDRDPFIMTFSYRDDLVEGIAIADSTCQAQPYSEPIERCFLYEFD